MALTIEFIQDCNGNPRIDYDNLGTMYCFSNRYTLGDEHELTIGEVNKIEKSNKYVTLPLYLYEHSGITMKTTPFSCQWDSGKVGIVTVNKEKVRNEFGVKRISKKFQEKIEQYLVNEVKEYDQCLRGQIFGYEIKLHDEVIDSLYGFYGDELKTNGMLDSIEKHYHDLLPERIELDKVHILGDNNTNDVTLNGVTPKSLHTDKFSLIWVNNHFVTGYFIQNNYTKESSLWDTGSESFNHWDNYRKDFEKGEDYFNNRCKIQFK